MKFLHGGEILDAIREMMEDRTLSQGPLDIAVAYWGKGALEITGLLARHNRKSGEVRIVCDLMSGACNPRPIKEMLDLGFDVRKFDGMHAKVWLCRERSIVGSANVSINGLGFENDEDITKSAHNREAALQSNSISVARAVKTWFDGLWNDSCSISQQDICLAIEKFDNRAHLKVNQRERINLPKVKRVIFRALGKQGRTYHGSIRFVRHNDQENSKSYTSHAQAVELVLKELSKNFTDDDFLSQAQEKGCKIMSRSYGNKLMPLVGRDREAVYRKPSSETRTHRAVQLGNSNWWLSNETGSKEKMDLIKSVCAIDLIDVKMDGQTKFGF